MRPAKRRMKAIAANEHVSKPVTVLMRSHHPQNGPDEFRGFQHTGNC